MGGEAVAWWVPFVAAVGGALVGGIFAILGGLVAETAAARQRRDEARRERRERWRREATEAAVIAYDVVQQALPDTVHPETSPDVIRERIAELTATHEQADRLLMALSVGRTHGTADAADAASDLRPALRATARRTALHGQRNLGRGDMEDYDRALETYLAARDALQRFELAITELDS